jgi:hypothetical protein
VYLAIALAYLVLTTLVSWGAARLVRARSMGATA